MFAVWKLVAAVATKERPSLVVLALCWDLFE